MSYARLVRRTLALTLVSCALAACNLVVPSTRHERGAVPLPDTARCPRGSLESCRSTSVCIESREECVECWGRGGRVELYIDDAEEARRISIAMRPAEAGATWLYVAYLVGPPGADVRVEVRRTRLDYDPLEAAFSASASTTQVVPLRGAFATLSAPIDVAIALDARGAVGVVVLAETSLVRGRLLEPPAGVGWDEVSPVSGEPYGGYGEVETFVGRAVGALALSPSAAGSGAAQLPALSIGFLARSEAGSHELIGMLPDVAPRLRRFLPGVALDFVALEGESAVTGPAAGEEAWRVDLAAADTATSFPTPGRNGSVALVSSDSVCTLAAWPAGDHVAFALSDRTSTECPLEAGGAAPTSVLHPEAAGHEEVSSVQVTSSRVGVVAHVVSAALEGGGLRSRFFVVGRDGWVRTLPGHGSFGVLGDDPGAGLVSSPERAAIGRPSPWPLAVARFSSVLDNGIASVVVVSMLRACDEGVE